MKEWLTEWLADKAADGSVKATTLARYRQVITTHLIPHLGRIKLDKLAARDVQRMVTGLRERPTPGSVIKVHGVLRVALGDAFRLDLVPRNVAKAAKLPAVNRTDCDGPMCGPDREGALRSADAPAG